MISKLWKRWTTTHSDNPFREKTIRVTSGILTLISGAAVLMQIGFTSNAAQLAYLLLIGSIFSLSSLSAMLVDRRHITAASYSLTAIFLTTSLGLVLMYGITAPPVSPILTLTLIMATLVLPRGALGATTTFTIGLIGLVTALQGHGLPEPTIANVGSAISVLNISLILMVAYVLLRQLRMEFDDRLSDKDIARQEAEKANRAKSQFLANMSHELRTPLNAIIGFTEILDMDINGELNPEQREAVQRTHANGERLLALINDILDLSRVEAGRTELKIEPVMPRILLSETLNSMRSLADKKGLILQSDFSSDTPETILSDPQKLTQIVTNLIGNSLKFTEHGGVYLSTEADNDNWLIKIRDTGIGIRPEDQSRIFEAFQQADNSDTRTHQGTGLGLAITRRFITLMNGSISVESQYEHGSTFTVRLPRQIGNA